MIKKIPFKLEVESNIISEYEFNGKNYLITVNDEVFTITKFNKLYEKIVYCDECNADTVIKNVLPLIKKDKVYLCLSCRNKGERNSMFGKKHKPETIDKFKNSRSGINNPFYGKKHSDETKVRVSNKNKGRLVGEKNPMYNTNVYDILVNKHGEETAKQIWTEKYQKHSLDMLGEKNPMYNTKVFDIWVEKYGLEEAVKLRENWVNNISETLSQYYKDNPDECIKISERLTGRVFSDEHRKNLRLSTINYIKRKLELLGDDLPKPAFNIEACYLFDKYSDKYNCTIEHALNGGEYYISELGYWVDGYDRQNNVVYEYYEKYHKYRENYDLNREREITEHLNCKFVIIKEGEEQKFLDNEI